MDKLTDLLQLKLDRAVRTCQRLGITPEQAIAVGNFLDCRHQLGARLYGVVKSHSRRCFFIGQFDKAFRSNFRMTEDQPEPLGSDW